MGAAGSRPPGAAPTNPELPPALGTASRGPEAPHGDRAQAGTAGRIWGWFVKSDAFGNLIKKMEPLGSEPPGVSEAFLPGGNGHGKGVGSEAKGKAQKYKGRGSGGVVTGSPPGLRSPVLKRHWSCLFGPAVREAGLSFMQKIKKSSKVKISVCCREDGPFNGVSSTGAIQARAGAGRPPGLDGVPLKELVQ